MIDRRQRQQFAIMGLLSWINRKGFGQVLADYGQIPSEQHGWRVSVSLRQIKDKAPYLLFQWEEGDSNRAWTSLACTPEVYEKLEQIIQDARRKVGGNAVQPGWLFADDWDDSTMLSLEARHLLNIPKHAFLSARLDDLYDDWFAGRSYETRFGGGWTFKRRGIDKAYGYDLCLSHRTAQCEFGLDERFRVFVQCDQWVPIASSFISLVEEDAVLMGSSARGDRRRGFGTFPSFEAFLSLKRDYLSSFQEVSRDPEFARIFRGTASVIIASRFYSDDYAICGIEYF